MASVRFELEVRGLQGLAANFVAADAEAQAAIRAATYRSAVRCQGYAQSLCPVDTGFMRDHIEIRYSDGGLVYALGWEEATFSAAGLAFYPLFVTQGHRVLHGQGLPPGYVPARPVLEPAFAIEAPLYTADVSVAVRDAYERRRAA